MRQPDAPIVVLSASVLPPDRARALECADVFVGKPNDLEDVRTALSALFTRKQA